jgi:hypothetical protein
MRDANVIVDEIAQSSAGTAAAPAPAAPDVVTLPEVLRQVRRDSRKQPEAYLDETTVRYGGE